MPIGHEDSLRGLVDLVERRAFHFEGPSGEQVVGECVKGGVEGKRRRGGGGESGHVWVDAQQQGAVAGGGASVAAPRCLLCLLSLLRCWQERERRCGGAQAPHGSAPPPVAPQLLLPVGVVAGAS